MKSQDNGKNGDPFKKLINVVCKSKVCYFVLVWHYQIFVMNFVLGNKKVWLFLIVNFGVFELGIKTRGYLKSEGLEMELA